MLSTICERVRTTIKSSGSHDNIPIKITLFDVLKTSKLSEYLEMHLCTIILIIKLTMIADLAKLNTNCNNSRARPPFFFSTKVEKNLPMRAASF